jgi:hypothetical protein
VTWWVVVLARAYVDARYEEEANAAGDSDCSCGFPGVECGCGSGEELWDGRLVCASCHGSGWVIREHCCVCGGSPYCTCCSRCGAACVSQCDCPITVQLEGGRELILP